MDAGDPYNDVVRACFADPVHAGDPERRYTRSLSAGAAESAHGVRLVLSAGIEGNTVKALRFRVWGCPHLIAAAEVYCREREGREVEALGSLDVDGMMERLAVPVGKTGRILLLEDAARSLFEMAAGKED